MVRKGLLISLVAVTAASLAVFAAGRREYPLVEKYIEEVQQVELTLPKAIAMVAEEQGGIPIAANLERDHEEEGAYLYTVVLVKPAKQGKRAAIWEVAIDANTGELMHMENASRWKERELKEWERERAERRRDEERERKEREQGEKEE